MKKGFLNGIAMIVLVVIAAIVLLNFILSRFDGSAGALVNIANWLIRITQLLGYIFLAVYAYDWAKAQRKGYWTIIYWVSVIVILILVVLGWFW